jgi:dienelactone hydrolase
MTRLLVAILCALACIAATPPETSRNIAFASTDGTELAGTLAWPAQTDGASAAFVLIGPDAVFAQLAGALNNAGFATLQYDPQRPYAEDVAAAVKAAAGDPHVDPARVYLLGYGEGGDVAMTAGATDAPLRGIVLLAPATQPYEDAAGREPIDPRVAIARVKVPMLLLHGSQDDAAAKTGLAGLLAAAHKAQRNLSYGELSGDNQLFQLQPPALDPRVAGAIMAWIAETS